MTSARACEQCLARTWLLARLAGHLEAVRGRVGPLLGLGASELIDAVGGEHRALLARELDRFDHISALERCATVGLEPLCRCDHEYPVSLLALASPPAVLHVAGGLERFLTLVHDEPVALVGARHASGYGLEVARSLGRGVGAAGITVVSGMALGVDSSAHTGALEAGPATIAVLPGGADRPYPAARRVLYRRIRDRGCVVSELPPGTSAWRWMFPARNRIIAGLSAMTVVIEAAVGSGSLVTARAARELGRLLGAVPGRVTSALAAGPNGLLADGAIVIRGVQDVLDGLFGAGVRQAVRDGRPRLAPELRTLLGAIADGQDTAEALASSGFEPDGGLAALASLELAGYLRRGAGGRFSVTP
jgi:DNA processing protein